MKTMLITWEPLVTSQFTFFGPMLFPNSKTFSVVQKNIHGFTQNDSNSSLTLQGTNPPSTWQTVNAVKLMLSQCFKENIYTIKNIHAIVSI